MDFSKEKLDAFNRDFGKLLEQYQKYSVSMLSQMWGLNMQSKNLLNSIVRRIIADCAPIADAYIERQQAVIKTIRLDKYGGLKESMSFPAFKYCDIINETWDESFLKKQFEKKLYIFAVFKMYEKDFFLEKIILWRMSEDVLTHGIKPVWQKVRACLQQGNIVKYIDDCGRYFSYFPASSENPYVHVRPHAKNREDTYPLPVADRLTGLVCYPKHSFWINRAYILKIISREE